MGTRMAALPEDEIPAALAAYRRGDAVVVLDEGPARIPPAGTQDDRHECGHFSEH